MSNLPLQSAVIHNDDNDEQTNSTTNNKLSTINSRITSPLIIKRQQNTETEIANNQAYDEIHDLQPKHSLIKKNNNSTRYNSHELMQGNYYDQNRYQNDYSSLTNHPSRPGLININLEDYKKTIAPVSTSKNSSNKNRTNSPPFGDTSESIQEGIAQSAGILLELNKNSMKTNNKSHESAVINYYPNSNDNDDDENSKQRSSSPSASSDCSTSDSSTSNKCQEDKNKSSIPYEKLLNDEDDDEESIEQTKKPITESSTLLTKTPFQTYGTQSTKNLSCEHGKYLQNNGYNSQGSTATKSSSDNSGSVRTNSGSDNDEESDEEHYNNSTASNTMPIYSRSNDTSMKILNKSNDNRYSNEQINYQLGRSNIIDNPNEKHLQINRLKHLPTDDSNGNKLTSGTDNNIHPYASQWTLQQSSNNQTNPSSSSSHQHLNHTEQQQSPHSKLSHNNSRQQQTRGTKKRKQSQQQDIIRTELIPGHRGDRDVDELVMFIDGSSSQQTPTLSHSTDSTKPRLNSKTNSLNDSNSNKTSSRKKSRKSIQNLEESISPTNNNENKTSDYLTPIEHDQPTTTTTHSIVDITNRNISTDNNTESQLNTVNVNSTNTINGEHSLPDWSEQTRNTSLESNDVDSYCSSPTITNNSNSETTSDPFVTVTRRRQIKERRQDNNNNNNSSLRSTRLPPPQSSSSSSNINDKRRIPSISQNGIIRPTIRNIPSNQKPINSSIIKEENNNNNNNNRIVSESTCPSSPPIVEPSSSNVNSTNEQSLDKQQSSPRLSSHSSSSSLSSLLKRTSKPPPVVFLNKSIDIELNDVSFGFDLDSTTLNKSSDDINSKSSTNELDNDITNSSIPSSNEPIQSNDSTTQKSTRKFQQRNNRGPQFYSGSDIRPHQHRNYPSQSIPQSSYIDPLLLLQYNQQRLANYSQQLAYMNLLRTQYMPPQSQYVFTPTTYQTTPNENEPNDDDTTNQTSSEQNQEPLYVYTTPTGQLYFHPSTTKKPSNEFEQQQQPSIPTVYTTTPTIYPSHYFYPSQPQHLIPPHTAYFQPISSPSLLIDTKSEQNNNHDDIDTDDNYENSTKVYQSTHQQSSSDIMSNALQLVYSQQKRNAQTDRFNLDDLTAYLAMKWTDSVDHYEQGDNRILLVDEQ